MESFLKSSDFQTSDEFTLMCIADIKDNTELFDIYDTVDMVLINNSLYCL